MDSSSHQLYSTTSHLSRDLFDEPTRNDVDNIPTVNATNPNYHPPPSTSSNTSSHWETSHPVVDSLSAQDKLRQGQRQVEDIFTKTKRHLNTNWEHTRRSLSQAQRKMAEMVPKQANGLIYWQKPLQTGVVFGLSLSLIITFMFLSALAAISFWFLALLVVIGLYKFYNYIMITFVGRVQDDIFESMFPPDVHVSEQQARAWANSICATGTSLLKSGRNLFLWQNWTSSLLFGLILFVFFYIGLSINALTFALIGLVLLFTVPKIYQVYQKPIDRTAKQVLDQINQLLAKVTSKLPTKAKKP